jgi:hypothetical protein
VPTEGAKRVVGLGAAAVAALLVWTSSATAAVQYVSNETTDPAAKSLSVACPDGMYVTGGGESTFNGYKGLRLRGSYPYDDGADPDTIPDDGWRIDFKNIGGYQVEVDGVCASDQPYYATQSFSIAAASRGTKGAGCRYHGHLYSGGARGGTLVSILPQDRSDGDSEPDDAFKAAIDNPKSVAAPAEVFAICGPADPDYPTFAGSVARKKGSNEHDADCPQGETAIGGGARIDAPYRGGSINSLFPLEDSFGAYFDNYSSRRRALTVIAVCASLP